jgi:DNA polymerase III delta prime subunit
VVEHTGEHADKLIAGHSGCYGCCGSGRSAQVIRLTRALPLPKIAGVPMVTTMPVLWITGPAGVGKSTVSWQLFTELAGSGTRTAFADADQLCMCYPAPPDDPGRDLIRARNAGVVVRNCQAAGARRVIVNGVVDPVLGVPRDLLQQAVVMVCRLRADPDEVVRRLASRQRASSGDMGDLARQVRDGCDRMDASDFAEVCVDTTGMSAGEVARLVMDRCRGWPGFGAVRGLPGAVPGSQGLPPGTAGSLACGCGGRVLLLFGPTGVGKSTIGFQLYQRCLRAGLTAGYVDLDQVGFVAPHPDGDPRNLMLKARNLAGIWRTYHAAGATHLVMGGAVGTQAGLRAYAAALPAAAITACRLHASPGELRRRIMTRGEGGSWPQPGDPLRGQPESYLSQVAEQAAADAGALDHTPLDALRIDTTGRTAAEAADLIAAAVGWPGHLTGISSRYPGTWSPASAARREQAAEQHRDVHRANAHATISGNSSRQNASPCDPARSVITTSAPASRSASAHRVAFS